ncbi:MAG TPA: hypothetical protein VFE57_01315, partial [Cyclobacteriaceae bacterium]|nr:hypothetical protein [Cyclobacteriaceae bacterium]
MSKKTFKKQKEKRNKKEQGGIYNALVKMLHESEDTEYSGAQIVKKLGLKKKSLIQDLYKILDGMMLDGQIEQLSDGRYKSATQSQKITGKLTGIVDHVNPRFAYVTTGEEGKKDVYIRTDDLGSALHGDTVAISLSKRRTGENPEGRVTEVLKRNRTRFVGRIEISKSFGFVVPDYKKIYQDFFVYPENLN